MRPAAWQPVAGLVVLLLTAGAGALAGAEPVPGAAGHLASSTADILNQLPPGVTFVLSTLGFGGIAGWCVGFTLKKFAKMMALLVGVLFIALQVLAYNRFITINWTAVEGVVPPESLQTIWVSLMSVMTYNFPFAGAFTAGFYLGFRKG
jgi:uncharacterized membrane protein (Fun14 family)